LLTKPCRHILHVPLFFPILSILFILIGLPKLFIGGEESAAVYAPQPTVNNFAAAAKMICGIVHFHPGKGGRAWPGRRIVYPKRPTFMDRVSLRAKCLDAKESSGAFRPQSLVAETNHYKVFQAVQAGAPAAKLKQIQSHANSK
jgi:hypothetical protein